MPIEVKKEIQLEIAHVLFIDIVGYSKLSINEQHAAVEELNRIVRASEQFQRAEAANRLIRIPTGDGMVLVFYTSPEAPAQCAVEISGALKEHPRLQVRMGIHSGPVSGIVDVNERANLAGAGINMAKRVMGCGDAGHILLSKHVAEDLEEYEQWRPLLHDLGSCEVKHGARLSVVNLYADQLGNPQLPKKFEALKKHSARMRWMGTTAALLALAAIVVGIVMFSRNRARPTLAAPGKSIAVLPFENRSEDKANAYFADGIQDEILTRLSKIANLKVISRTSTQHYKSTPENLPEIARQLGVAHILEGSVQRAANKVRVNAQLIDARNDAHLWAQTYDRDLADVFAIQSEIAKAIADQLQAKLSRAEQQAISDRPTQNVEAYDAYLRGLAIEHDQYGYSNFHKAAQAYSEAVRLDPGFAPAWARLASIRSFLFFSGLDLAANSAAAVKEAVDRSVALRPDAGETWIALGAYRYRVLRDFPSALQAYDEARKRLPNNASVLQYMAYVERRLGQWERATEHYRRAAKLDPRDFQIFVSMGSELLNFLRRFKEAHAALDHALEITPNEPGALANKAFLFQCEGRLREAAEILARIPHDSRDEVVDYTRVTQAIRERQFEQAIAIIKANVDGPKSSLSSTAKLFRVELGYCQEWSGQSDEARLTYARAVQSIKPSPEFVVAPEGIGLPYQLALAYAGLGDKEKALEQARRAVADYETDAVAKPQAEAALAQIQARFGDFDSAIAALPHLLEVPAGINVADLRFDPFWDPVRGDPRFEKIVASLAPEKP